MTVLALYALGATAEQQDVAGSSGAEHLVVLGPGLLLLLSAFGAGACTA